VARDDTNFVCPGCLLSGRIPGSGILTGFPFPLRLLFFPALPTEVGKTGAKEATIEPA